MNDFAATVLTEESPRYRVSNEPKDANGIPIRPGYRPPFKKGEFDPRRFVPQKGVKVPHLQPSTTQKVLGAIHKALAKHAELCHSATDPDLAMRHAKVCRLFCDIELDFKGQGKKSPKHGYKPYLAGQSPMANVAPISSPKCPTIEAPSTDQNPSQVKPSATPATPEQVPQSPTDDAPF